MLGWHAGPECKHHRCGQLDKGQHTATALGRTVVDMNQDWRRIYAFEKS